VISYRDLVQAFHNLGLRLSSRVVAHVSLPALGPVAGGAESLVGALLASCETVIMPAFTYRTLVTPALGPEGNALAYSESAPDNASAEIFRPDLPADSDLGPVAEKLRSHPRARRSDHPVLSFTGVNATDALARQSLDEPLAPIAWLAEYDGDVLLIGGDHRSNVSLHLAERIAGRKQFVRWALGPAGVAVCPNFPGCSDGFGSVGPRLEGVARRERLGEATLEIIPLRDLLHVAVGWIRQDARALLCDRRAAVRASLRTVV
jgi:aminoglycoside 3-N-acetyltransferase